MCQQPILDWEGIKAELGRRGFSLARIAKDTGIHPSAVRNVKIKHHKRAEEAIAACIEMASQQLWPERYKGKPRLVSKQYKAFLSKGSAAANEKMVKAS